MLTSSHNESSIMDGSSDSRGQANMAAPNAAQPLSFDDKATLIGCCPGIDKVAVRHSSAAAGRSPTGATANPSIVEVTCETARASASRGGIGLMADDLYRSSARQEASLEACFVENEDDDGEVGRQMQ